MKKKFSKKGKGGKIHLTPEEKKDAMSHKNKKNQQWKEELIEEAKVLWEANKTKPPKEQLSMRAIATKLNLPKTTVIERLSGRRKGEGHIAGGKRKARVLMDGKQAGQNNCNRNHFNRTFNWVSKQVIPLVACTGDPVSCKLTYFISKPIFHPFFTRPRRWTWRTHDILCVEGISLLRWQTVSASFWIGIQDEEKGVFAD